MIMTKPTYEQLEMQIADLEYELKSLKKYGLIWDKDNTKEDVTLKCEKNIPILIQDASRRIVTYKGENNILIEGDNYHILVSLNLTMKESIDIIYIDPPYNTGNKDLVFNDSFVNEDDGYKHSKWLSFMQKRLLLAKNLLKENSFIFISIDDREFAQLKLLCDEIFGYHNFLTMFIRKTKSMTGDDENGLNIQHEYLLLYAKNIKKVKFVGEKKSFERFSNPDNDPNGVWTSADPSAKSGGDSTYFPIKNPITGQIDYPPNGRYWAFSRETLEKYILSGRVKFKSEIRKKQRGFIFKRYYESMKNICQPVGTLDFVDNIYMNSVATSELKEIIGAGKFDYPKPVQFIKDLIKYSSSPNAIILDFFAGSGTTGQAVMELNKEDGGHRRFILCTNNENNICADITYTRLKTVITGIRDDGTRYSDGIPNNLFYFKTDFVRNEANTEQACYCLVEKIDGLLCITENIFEEVERNDYSSHYQSENKHLFIFNDYYSKEKFAEFKKRVLETNGLKIVYVYSSDNNFDESLIDDKDVIIKPIPSKIYEIYKEIVERIKRGE